MMKYLLLLACIAAINSQYTVVDKDIGSTYIKLSLNYTGRHQYYVKTKSKVSKQLIFHFQALTYNDFAFKIYDPTKPTFQLPQGGIFPQDPKETFSFPLTVASYKINYTANHFGFCITRKANDAVIFDSSVVEIEFSDYYIQFGTILDSKTLFGYSERNSQRFKLQPGTWTLWSREQGPVIDKGSALNSKQKSGYYPAYLMRESAGLHHIGYFRSSNAIDVEVESFSNTSYLKIYRAVGGIINMRFMLGNEDPQQSLKSLHNYLGSSLIPPFWALGYHQSRWGYQNITALENVIANFQKNDIPLDTIWNDMDYFGPNETFSINTQKFPLDRLRSILKEYQYIPILEIGIRNKKGYAYEEGLKRNVFIKDAEGNNYLGQMDSGKCLFTDFFHPNSTAYWGDMLQYLYNQVQFSGLWLDANQITQDCDGPCETPTGTTVIDYVNDIPYTPGGGSIEKTLLSLNATHFGNILQANVHTLHSLMHQYNTHQFLKDKKQPFILSSGSTLGTNRYAFHWSGDNYANFTYLKSSIISNFMFGMWGIQMMGSDICGFSGNTTEQVCSRFYQLGSLYPFSRNHNEITAKAQQPYALGPVVLQASRKNLKLRYSLLKFYYREFIIRKGIGTIFRPLYYEFFDDQNVLRDEILQTQFLIGDSLMSAPILQEGKTSRTAYFPQDFYNLFTGQLHAGNSIALIQNNLTDLVPLFLRDGYMIFRQQTQNITKTRQLGIVFNLIGGFQKIKSNTTTITYRSKGGLLSLSDYGRQQYLKVCVTEGCDYQIQGILNINRQSRDKQLNLSWTFAGKSMKFQQRIAKITIYTEQQVLNYTPPEEIPIYGTNSQNFLFK